MDKQKKEQKKKKKSWLLWILLILLILLLFWRCSREETPDFIREYEEHIERQYDNMEAGDNARLNMAVSQLYEINDKEPFFYIGYPENNGYDIVLSFFSDSGEVLYQTKYIAPGTNVKIPGGNFAEKGLREYSCNIAAYDQETGELISDSVQVIMKIQYD